MVKSGGDFQKFGQHKNEIALKKILFLKKREENLNRWEFQKMNVWSFSDEFKIVVTKK